MSAMPRTSRNRTARSSGFTLIELLAVMLILTILIALVVGVANRIFHHVNITETQTSMKIIMSSIVEYHKVKSAYPTNQTSLVSDLKSVEKSRTLMKNLDKKVWPGGNEFLDPWGKPIFYYPSGGLGGGPGLTSAGPDGDIATEEDNVRNNK